MSEVDIEKLEKFLQENTIPKVKVHPKTFLGIAKQPHYENVLSNIYAFYFDTNEEHKLGDLFIKSFIRLINRKFDIPFEAFTNFDIFTEYTTDKGGRIDLLLMNNEKALIIENKVYHYLNNDLDDYWNSIENRTKKGIVLSLKKIFHILPDLCPESHPKPCPKPYPNPYPFINITHLELLNEVMMNLGGYLLNANDKYIIFLKDLYQNIINLSNQMETKYVDFFFNNIEKINDIEKVKEQLKSYIKEQVDISCNIIGDTVYLIKPRGGYEQVLRYFVSSKNSGLMFTVVFNDILVNKELFIAIEVQHKAKDIINSNIQEYKAINTKLLKENETFKNGEYWAHLYSQTCELKTENIKDLSVNIADEIQKEPFSSIFKKVEDFLSSKDNN